MKLPAYNSEGQETEKVELKGQSLLVEFNPDLVHQVAVSLENNQRIYTAHTKNRGEVRGGGKKPWKQKGTGRARAGSIRSPIWKGGGITFGPRNERNYSTKINKKVAHKVFAMVLGEKIKANQIKVIEKWQAEKPKTKELAKLLDKICATKDKSVLMATEKTNESLKMSGRNISGLSIKIVDDLCALDLLKNKFIVIEKTGLDILKSRLNNKSNEKKK